MSSTNVLLDTTDRAEFDSAVSTIRRVAPGASSWLDWWINPIHAALIFPVHMTMPEDVRLTAPRTNNNAEAINRSEQRVQRSNATLVVQVEEEFEFVKAQEVEYRRINRGETGRHSGLRRISKGKEHERRNPEWLEAEGGKCPDNNKEQDKKDRAKKNKEKQKKREASASSTSSRPQKKQNTQAGAASADTLRPREWVYTWINPSKAKTLKNVYIYRVVRKVRGQPEYKLQWHKQDGTNKNLFTKTEQFEQEHIDAIMLLETGAEFNGSMRPVPGSVDSTFNFMPGI